MRTSSILVPIALLPHNLCCPVVNKMCQSLAYPVFWTLAHGWFPPSKVISSTKICSWMTACGLFGGNQPLAWVWTTWQTCRLFCLQHAAGIYEQWAPACCSFTLNNSSLWPVGFMCQAKQTKTCCTLQMTLIPFSPSVANNRWWSHYNM